MGDPGEHPSPLCFRGAGLGRPVPSAGLGPPLHGHTSFFLEPPHPNPAESQALLPSMSALSVPCKAAQSPHGRDLPPALCTVYPELSALWPLGVPGCPLLISFCISKPWGVTVASQGQSSPTSSRRPLGCVRRDGKEAVQLTKDQITMSLVNHGRNF